MKTIPNAVSADELKDILAGEDVSVGDQNRDFYLELSAQGCIELFKQYVREGSNGHTGMSQELNTRASNLLAFIMDSSKDDFIPAFMCAKAMLNDFRLGIMVMICPAFQRFGSAYAALIKENESIWGGDVLRSEYKEFAAKYFLTREEYRAEVEKETA